MVTMNPRKNFPGKIAPIAPQMARPDQQQKCVTVTATNDPPIVLTTLDVLTGAVADLPEAT